MRQLMGIHGETFHAGSAPFLKHEKKKRKERAEKNNTFERFSGDSTLTFLTSGNTFRLVILPTRRVVFPGCASSFS